MVFGAASGAREREFFIDNLLVRIHFIIEMIWWTGLAPWEFEFPFPGSLTSTFQEGGARLRRTDRVVEALSRKSVILCKATPVILHGVVSPELSKKMLSMLGGLSGDAGSGRAQVAVRDGGFVSMSSTEEKMGPQHVRAYISL